MKLRRNAQQSRSRRQRQVSDDLTPAQPSFLYRARRSESRQALGRQAEAQAPARRQRIGYSWLQRAGLFILLLAIVASVINVLSLSTEPKVVVLSTASQRSILEPTARYEAAAGHQLSSSIWNRNKITVNTSQLSHQLLAQFSELSSVSVTLPLLAHRPLVYIQPAQPVLILVTPQNEAFMIDDNGKVLLRAANPSDFNQPSLPVITDQSGLSPNLNKQVLPASSVRFVQTVVAQLAAKQLAVAGMTLPPATNELDVHLVGRAYFVKFNLQSTNPRGEAGTFLATIAQLTKQSITPTQYVDVRVDGRAYYQ
jgi:hypothetical protein